MINKTYLNAAELFLKRKDYEILDTNLAAPIQIVAKDRNVVVFAQVKKLPNEFNEEECSDAIDAKQRFDLETFACDWINEHDGVNDCPIRFDVIGIRKIDGNNGLLRHHINAFGVSHDKVVTEDE